MLKLLESVEASVCYNWSRLRNHHNACTSFEEFIFDHLAPLLGSLEVLPECHADIFIKMTKDYLEERIKKFKDHNPDKSGAFSSRSAFRYEKIWFLHVEMVKGGMVAEFDQPYLLWSSAPYPSWRWAMGQKAASDARDGSPVAAISTTFLPDFDFDSFRWHLHQNTETERVSYKSSALLPPDFDSLQQFSYRIASSFEDDPVIGCC